MKQEDGVKVIKIKNWNEFREYVDSIDQTYYWRGHSDPIYVLASSFERTILRLNGGWLKKASNNYPYDNRFNRNGKRLWESGFVKKMRDRYLAAFKTYTKGIRGTNPKKLSDNDYWILGRHYRLVTPLLDWTTKPYIAAFFALTGLLTKMKARSSKLGISSLSYGGEICVIYQLFHNIELEDKNFKVVHTENLEEDKRPISQFSVSTMLESEEYFELEGYLKSRNKPKLLKRIELSDQCVRSGLEDLEKHGINYLSLFPDLYGAAKQTNFIFEK